jgi:predicted DNA binding protein
MRAATVRITPPEEPSHPAAKALVAHPDVTPGTVEHMTALSDGTVVVMVQFQGDAGIVEEILSGAEVVLEHHLTKEDRTVYGQIHFEPTPTSEALLALRRDYTLTVQMPIQFDVGGSVKISVIGEERTIQRAIDSLPDSFGTELLKIGEYEPDSDRPEAQLTSRQREVLEAAFDVGYYEEPREGTQADVAEAVGLAPATAGEHLRRIEGNVLRALRE